MRDDCKTAPAAVVYIGEGRAVVRWKGGRQLSPAVVRMIANTLRLALKNEI